MLMTKKAQKQDYFEYLMDTVGLVVIRNAIPESTVGEAISALNLVYHGGKKPWKFPILDAGRVFWDVLTNKAMLSMAEKMCGEYFRLDHAFGVCSDELVVNLHGGPNCSFGSCFFKADNQPLVSQLSCGIALAPQSPETKGMCYIPGSHKSSDQRDGRTIKKELLNDDLENDCLVVPRLNPGDLVVFSESLVHGDNGWLPKNYSRLMLYYKFCPGFVCWRDPKEQEKYISMASNDLERRLLESPWSGRFSDDNHIMDKANARRNTTLNDISTAAG